MTKFAVRPDKANRAVWHDGDFGPCFGGLCWDLYLLVYNSGNFSKGSTYELEESELSGSYKFSVDEIEVFVV